MFNTIFFIIYYVLLTFSPENCNIYTQNENIFYGYNSKFGVSLYFSNKYTAAIVKTQSPDINYRIIH